MKRARFEARPWPSDPRGKSELSLVICGDAHVGVPCIDGDGVAESSLAEGERGQVAPYGAHNQAVMLVLGT